MSTKDTGLDNLSTKEQKSDNLATSGKVSKDASTSHLSRSRLETEVNKFYQGPKLTADMLEEIDTRALQLPENGHPDYSYIWLSTDSRAIPHLTEALGRRGYTVVTIEELPEMAKYVYKTMDTSLSSDAIVFKEMVLCKIHKIDLELIVTTDHHIKPNQMARDVYRNFKGAIQERGNKVVFSTDAEVLDSDRRFVSNKDTQNPKATGIITQGRDGVKRVIPRFDI